MIQRDLAQPLRSCSVLHAREPDEKRGSVVALTRRRASARHDGAGAQPRALSRARVRSAACALAALCRAAAVAQSALFPHAARLARSLWLGDEAFALLDALFGNRPDLCARVPAAR